MGFSSHVARFSFGPPAAHEITEGNIELVFVALTLSVHARAFNLGKLPYNPALGRVLAWETPPPYGTALAHLVYLGGLQTSQTASQHISVSNRTECCAIGQKFP